MATFLTLTALDGTSVRINAGELCFMEPVPAAYLPAGVVAGTYMRTLGRDQLAVIGTPAANAAGSIVIAAGALTLIGLTRVDGETVFVNPETVAHMEVVPAELLPAGVTDGTYLRSAQPEVQLVVQGTIAATTTALTADGGLVQAGQYTPTYTLTGDVTSCTGNLRFQVVNNFVRVFGRVQVEFSVTPGAGDGLATLPPGTESGVAIEQFGLLMSLNANGYAGDVVSDGATQARMRDVACFAPATLTDFWVDFSYLRAPA